MALNLICDGCHNEIPTNGLPSHKILCETCVDNGNDGLKQDVEDLQTALLEANEKIKNYESILKNVKEAFE